MKRALALALALCWTLAAEPVHVAGLQQQVEILRDRWGVPHIYAATVHDLFFAQGYIAAATVSSRSISGAASEPANSPKSSVHPRWPRPARPRRHFRGDWNAEWAAYGPDAESIVTAFTDGINAYIRVLKGSCPLEFQHGRLRLRSLWAARRLPRPALPV